MRIVCLAGIDGCGKSTQADLLTRWFEERGRRVRATGVWDALEDPELNTGEFMGDPAQFRAYLSSLSSPARCLFIFHALFESFLRARRDKADVLLTVAYWPKYAVVEELLGTPRPLLESLAALFPAPDLTLWIDLDPSVAAARRETFSVYECGGGEPGAEAFTAFQARCRDRLAGFASERGWVRVDGAGEEAEVLERLTCEIEGRLPS